MSHSLETNVEYLVLTGAADVNGTGNGLANRITGNKGANHLNGGGGPDRLYGRGGADTLVGGTGKDILDGGIGDDSMAGGGGNDIYRVDSAGDVVKEDSGQGYDKVRASVSHTLAANVEDLRLLGSDALSGTGNNLANRLIGNAGANQLTGNAGADTLIGGAGMDSLTGGRGADSFVFDAALDAATNVDTVTDFVAGKDKLVLDDAVFSAIGATGALAAGDARFYAADGATGGHDADDRLVYDMTSGALYYDADGSGAAAAIQFAQLGVSTHPSLSAADIVIA